MKKVNDMSSHIAGAVIYNAGAVMNKMREDAGLNLYELAEVLDSNWTASEIRDYENNLSPISLRYATKLCEVFGVSYKEFTKQVLESEDPDIWDSEVGKLMHRIIEELDNPVDDVYLTNFS